MKETWRGWQGHHICHCRWHLNTLLELDKYKIVVSTVGKNYNTKGEPETIGHNRYFETMVFEAEEDQWNDADVTKQIDLYAPYQTEEEAQTGHYVILQKAKDYMINRMLKGS